MRIILCLSWLVILSQFETNQAVTDTVNVASTDSVIYSKIGANVSFVYTITSSKPLTSIAFTYTPPGDQNQFAIAEVKFKDGNYKMTIDSASKYKDRISVLYDDKSGTVTYNLKSLQKEDFKNLTFQCKAAISIFVEGIKDITLIEADPPKIFTADFFTKIKVSIKRDANTEYICRASGKPDPIVKWIFKNKTIVQSTKKATLLITKASLESDVGTYTCQAENNGGIDKDDMNIIVTYMDYSTDSDSTTQSFKTGREINQECLIKGYPTPEYAWRKDGSVIQSNKILHFKSGTDDDAGNYTCTATNPFDEDDKLWFALRLVRDPNSDPTSGTSVPIGSGSTSMHMTMFGFILTIFSHIACIVVFQ